MSVLSRQLRVLDEKRIIDFIEGQYAMSESASSLANKLGIEAKTVRRVLDHLVDAGAMRRRELGKSEPIYYRYPSLDER
jgi:predicted ArsR family transcriptional regulator